MESVNNGKAPKISKLEKINFVRNGKEPAVKNCRSSRSLPDATFVADS